MTFMSDGRSAARMTSSLGVSTLCSFAFLTTFSMIGDNSIPLFASKSTSNEGLKSAPRLGGVPLGRMEGA